MKVFVAIVTYNRADLLSRALHCTERQTYKASTCCVIDNASTDHTQVVMQGACQRGVRYFRLSSNTGGAGGFSLATRLFMASQDDALLLFDDDAVPDIQMIEHLVRVIEQEKLDVANALVLSEANPECLAFALWPISKDATFQGAIYTKEEMLLRSRRNILLGAANPFNGTLFRRSIVERIGFIDARMFIWGDEVDYIGRAARAGAKIGVVCEAVITHPPDRNTWITLPFLGKVFLPPDARAHIWFRNRGHLDATGGRRFGLFLRAGKVFLSYLILAKPLLGLKSVIYFFDGVLNTYCLSPKGSMLQGDVEREARRLADIERQ
jgi:rhamnopyranosyl-N-acetylglucosaminyl-diphospho-decaprenol beta-1,3/1,4-galactofuranosyltransferase